MWRSLPLICLLNYTRMMKQFPWFHLTLPVVMLLNDASIDATADASSSSADAGAASAGWRLQMQNFPSNEKRNTNNKKSNQFVCLQKWQQWMSTLPKINSLKTMRGILKTQNILENWIRRKMWSADWNTWLGLIHSAGGPTIQCTKTGWSRHHCMDSMRIKWFDAEPLSKKSISRPVQPKRSSLIIAHFK